MTGADTLAALAQVSVTLAGFAGIGVALGRRDQGEFTPADLLGLGALLRPSLAAAAWAFVPLVLDSAAVPEPRIWMLSSAGYMVFVVGMVAFFVVPQVRRAGVPIGGALVSTSVCAGLLAANTIWLREAWPHLTVLVLSLVISVFGFVSLVVRRR
jgi:hypothetical protein